MCVLYWIRDKNHKDIKSEGYVGVTTEKDPYTRFKNHKDSKNYNIINAFKNIENVIFEIIIEESPEFCYLLENELRPKSKIGWNLSAGGRSSSYFYSTKKQKEAASEWSKNLIEKGTHIFLIPGFSSKHQKLLVENGTHSFLNGKATKQQLLDGKHASQYKWTCEYCKTEGYNKMNYVKWHGENCKYKNFEIPINKFKKKMARILCPNGKTIEVRNVAKFCRERNIPISLMHSTLRKEKTNCRGYTGEYFVQFS